MRKPRCKEKVEQEQAQALALAVLENEPSMILGRIRLSPEEDEKREACFTAHQGK